MESMLKLPTNPEYNLHWRRVRVHPKCELCCQPTKTVSHIAGVFICTERMGYVQRQNTEMPQYGHRLFPPVSTDANQTMPARIREVGRAWAI